MEPTQFIAERPDNQPLFLQTASRLLPELDAALSRLAANKSGLAVALYNGQPKHNFCHDRPALTQRLSLDLPQCAPYLQLGNEPAYPYVASGNAAAALNLLSGQNPGSLEPWFQLLELNPWIMFQDWGGLEPFILCLETIAEAPYIYSRLVTGVVVDSAKNQQKGLITPTRDNRMAPWADIRENLVHILSESGCLHILDENFWAIQGDDFKNVLSNTLKLNSNLMAALNPEPAPESPYAPPLKPDAEMLKIMRAVWPLPRDLVSPGYDAALGIIVDQLPMEIHEYPTGEPCYTWLVPEQWTCHEAWLEDDQGQRLFSYEDNICHVMSYSLPFEGRISRRDLFDHLHSHPHLPDAVPFKFNYYDRDWGLCCSQSFKESLQQPYYRVKIDSRSGKGSLKVGEAYLEGKSSRTIVLCAHLCHNLAANDGLSGVVVGLGAMRALAQKKQRRFSYRFLVLPETIGSLAWLSHNENLIPSLHGGLFLEMLGLDNPFSLQYSFGADSEVDICFELGLKAVAQDMWCTPFRSVPGNDERQFNAPGVRVPMSSLSRMQRPGTSGFPYPQYHSDHDSPAIISQERLDESLGTVMAMLECLENNYVPLNLFKGEVFLSRYGLNPGSFLEAADHQALFAVLFRIDGTRSLAQIAKEISEPFGRVLNICEKLRKHGLVRAIYPEQEE